MATQEELRQAAEDLGREKANLDWRRNWTLYLSADEHTCPQRIARLSIRVRELEEDVRAARRERDEVKEAIKRKDGRTQQVETATKELRQEVEKV